MFCPNCGIEYEPGVTTCAECQVALVAEAPDMEPHFQDTVNVFESDDSGEIALAFGRLAARAGPGTAAPSPAR